MKPCKTFKQLKTKAYLMPKRAEGSTLAMAVLPSKGALERACGTKATSGGSGSGRPGEVRLDGKRIGIAQAGEGDEKKGL